MAAAMSASCLYSPLATSIFEKGSVTMPMVIICDADGKTVMELGEVNRAGWGLVRMYCDEVMPDVDEFSNEMLDAAKDAQQSFAERLAVARKKFHVKYPNGLLPDEMEEVDEKTEVSE